MRRAAEVFAKSSRASGLASDVAHLEPRVLVLSAVVAEAKAREANPRVIAMKMSSSAVRDAIVDDREGIPERHACVPVSSMNAKKLDAAIPTCDHNRARSVRRADAVRPRTVPVVRPCTSCRLGIQPSRRREDRRQAAAQNHRVSPRSLTTAPHHYDDPTTAARHSLTPPPDS